MVMSKRIGWIDTTKGFCILLMVLGHYQLSPFWMKDLIYSFHMPIFFVMSGILASPKYSYWHYISGKFYSLFLPFILLSFIIGGGQLLVCGNINNFFSDVIVKSLINNEPSSQPLWFLYTLFITDMIYYPFRSTSIKRKNIAVVICVGIGILLLSNGIRLPLRFDIIPFSLGYYIVGSIISHHIIKFGVRNTFSKSLKIFILCFWLLYIPLVLNLKSYDLYCGIGAWYSFLVAVLGSILVLITIIVIHVKLNYRIHRFCLMISINAIAIIAFHSKLFWVADMIRGSVTLLSSNLLFTIFVIFIQLFGMSLISSFFNNYLSICVGKYKR